MTIYTIIAKQETHVAWDRCSGYDGTYEGGFQMEWFNDRAKALEFWAERLFQNKYIVKEEENTYEYELTLFIDGKSTSVSYSNLRDDDEEYDRLNRLEEDFRSDGDELFAVKEKEFLARREAERLEKRRQEAEAQQARIAEAAARKRKQDLETLARLQAEYGNEKGS